jgi:O-antigen/teichoic acid export membrane protein
LVFLANLSHFNLTDALNRFLPNAGGETRWLIVRFYLTGLTTALVASLIFVYVAGMWTPALSFLKSSPYLVLGFTVATMTWCIFVLQSSVIASLRRPARVPVESVILAFTKITLLLGFVSLLPRFGIMASWTVSVLVVVLSANLFIFRSLVPTNTRATEGRAEPVVLSRIAKVVAGDYVASVIGSVPLIVLPLMVLDRSGAVSTAYYFIAWSIAYSLYLVNQNMGASLVAGAATDPIKLNIYSYRVFVQSARLVVPAAIVMVIGAPYLLRLFGQHFAAEGTVLLRLVCLSAIPHVITSSYLSIVRVQRRTRMLILVVTLLSVLVLSLSYFLLGIYGINGIGLAWLLSQFVVATALLITQLGKFWLPHIDVRILLRLLAVPRGLSWYWNKHRVKADSAGLLPAVLSRIAPLANAPHPANWCVQGLAETVNDVTVITLGPHGHPPVALLKLPRSDFATASLKKQNDVLTRLHADERLGPWRALLPTLLAEGDTAENYYLVEQMQSGIDARTLVSDPDTRMQMRAAAAKAIGFLHRRTVTSVVVDAGMLERWVNVPISRIKAALERSRPTQGYHRTLDELTNELQSSLIGKKLPVCWVHGDFTPGNILLTAEPGGVAGILDWDQATPEDLPQLDLALLFLSTRMLSQRRELGDIVVKMLDGDEWTSDELDLLNTARESLPGDAVGMRELVLLTWLRHVDANLSKSTRYFGHKLWTAKNIEAVLLCL